MQDKCLASPKTACIYILTYIICTYIRQGAQICQLLSIPSTLLSFTNARLKNRASHQLLIDMSAPQRAAAAAATAAAPAREQGGFMVRPPLQPLVAKRNHLPRAPPSSGQYPARHQRYHYFLRRPECIQYQPLSPPAPTSVSNTELQSSLLAITATMLAPPPILWQPETLRTDITARMWTSICTTRKRYLLFGPKALRWI